jgi:DNA-binding response OmpR family regulator
VSSLFGLGADDCLDKPYNLAELVTLVRQEIATLPTPSAPSHDQEQQPLEWPAKVLIVEDEPDWNKRLARYLQRAPDRYAIQSANDYATARRMLEEPDLDVVILDLRLIENSADFQGMQLLELLREKGPAVAVVVVSAYGTVAHIKDGFQLYNISAYLSKQSFSPDRFRAAVRRAARQRQWEA